MRIEYNVGQNVGQASHSTAFPRSLPERSQFGDSVICGDMPREALLMDLAHVWPLEIDRSIRIAFNLYIREGGLGVMQ